MTPLESVLPSFCGSCGAMRLVDGEGCGCAEVAPVPGIVERLLESALPLATAVPNMRNVVRGSSDPAELLEEVRQLEEALVSDLWGALSAEPLLRGVGEAAVRDGVRAHLAAIMAAV